MFTYCLEILPVPATMTVRTVGLDQVPLTVKVAGMPPVPCELLALKRMLAALAVKIKLASSAGRTVIGLVSAH